MRRLFASGLAFSLAVWPAAAQTPRLPSSQFGSVAVTAEYGLTASGLNQASAKALPSAFQVHEFATVPVGGGARLPACNGTAPITTVVNDGANQLYVYPITGDAIGALGANSPTLVDTKSSQTFTCSALHQWQMQPFVVGVDPILTYRCGPGTCVKLNPSTKINNPLGNVGTYGHFTPTLTFATPGDLSVSYTVQDGVYYQIGQLVCVNGTISGTPTYTTASSSIRLASLPFASNNDTVSNGRLQISNMTGITYPASSVGNPYGAVILNNAYAQLTTMRTGLAATAFTTTQLPTGTAFSFSFDGCYIGKSS